MESKIRVKLGSMEVEYEGSETFLKQELPGFIKTVAELYRASNMPPEESDKKEHGGTPAKLQLSTASIAAKLSCSGGPDLLLAAAAHLTFAKDSEVFTRPQLLTEIKTARAYYKKSHGANLTALLNGLVKGKKFNEPTTGTFSLAAESKKDLEKQLAIKI